MTAWLVRLAVAHHRWVVTFAVLGMLAAAAVGSQLKLDALPDITTNQVLVLTRAPGLPPEEVERLVTRPIEVALGGLPGLREQRSLSRFGISSVTAVFEDDVPPYLARQVAQERLSTILGELPPGIGPPELGPLSGGLGEIFHFTLSSDRRTAGELLELATLKLAPLLRSVRGVVEVNTWGGETRTIEVIADPVRLAQRGLTLSMLREALVRATGSVAGASLPAGDRQALLRGVARPRDPSALGSAIVQRAAVDDEKALPVRVADVASVAQGTLPRIGAATHNGHGETVYLMAQMLRGENALEVMDGLHAQMAAVRRLLPPDVQIEVVYDRSLLVRSTLRTVAHNLIEGGVLVIAVLFAMLGSWRAGLIVAAVIPLAMLGALVGMVALGIPGNLMSLGAIDFGLLVDGAVVMVENLFHHLAVRPSDSAASSAGDYRARIGELTSSVARPVFFSVLIILLVYVPVLALGGVEGKMFRPMAVTVICAMLTALVLSLTVVPALCALVLRPQDVPSRQPALVRLTERVYPPVLAQAVRRPRLIAGLALGLLMLGGILFHYAGSEFVPQLDEGDLVIQTTRAADIGLPAAVREAGRLERALLGHVPEVRQVVSRVGNPAVATDIMGIEQADVFVALRPRAEWRPGLTRDALIQDLQRALEKDAPGSSPSFTQPIEMRFNELLAGSVSDVVIGIYGDDLGELQRLGQQLAHVVAAEPGATDVRLLAPPAVPVLEVVPRPLEASQAGFAVADVLDAVQAIRTGLDAGATYDGPVRIPILLRLGGEPSAFTLSQLPLPTGSGGTIPLSWVADVRLISAPGQVNRYNAERRLLVGFNVRGADLGTVVARAQARVAPIALPQGCRLEWGGQYQTLQQAKKRLLIVIPIVLLLILGVLGLAFRKLRPALVIFSHVPFSSVGGMVALVARGMPVSISAAIGFIALSGVAVLNGVVLMSCIITHESAGVRPGTAAMVAARERARPVLTTALVAALGFIPMMLATGVGAEVQRPLATVVVGGLVSSTLLTLVILPTLYPWFAGQAKKEGR